MVRLLKSVFDASEMQGIDAGTFFNLAGATLLTRIYGKRCQPVAGAAFYKLDDEAGSVLSFHDDNDREHLSSLRGFHCWILCDGFIVDFLAPMFREALAATGKGKTCSRKMFQKPLSKMADSRLQMRQPGDFFLLPNVELTRQVLGDFHAQDAVADLLELCLHWYRKPPAKMEPELAAQGGDGSLIRMRLDELTLAGVW